MKSPLSSESLVVVLAGSLEGFGGRRGGVLGLGSEVPVPSDVELEMEDEASSASESLANDCRFISSTFILILSSTSSLLNVETAAVLVSFDSPVPYN